MNLDSSSKEELQELLAHCIVDIKFTCKLLFPDIFYAPFSTLHQQVFDLINSGVKKIAIAAPRGIGKTSIARTVAMSPLAFLVHPERWLWAIHRHRGTLSAAPNFGYELCLNKIEPPQLEGLDLSS